MTGIGGVKMWMEDYMLNAPSYSKEYREKFIKIKDLWNECVKAFKECKSIKACNDCYTEYEQKVDELREECDKFFGRNRMPIGINDTLDYFEEAVGDLEDKYLDKLTSNPNDYVLRLPETYGKYAEQICGEYERDYPDVKFTADNGGFITVRGKFIDVRSFLEEEFGWESGSELVTLGEWE